MTYTFMWLNTIVADYWKHQPGPARAEIVAAVSREAAESDVTFLAPPEIQVLGDESLPEGLLKVVVTAPASVSKASRLVTEPPPMQKRKTAVHGTRSKYTAGCRCDSCSAAESVYQAARYRRRKARQMQEAS